jgi:hypothetical protein
MYRLLPVPRGYFYLGTLRSDKRVSGATTYENVSMISPETPARLQSKKGSLSGPKSTKARELAALYEGESTIGSRLSGQYH